MKKILPLLLPIFVFSLFTYISSIYVDPDFFYRIKTGASILTSTFPRTDPYSYTMPSFPYTEHSWLIAIFWAILFPHIGHIGLSLFSAFFALCALFVTTKRYVFPPFSSYEKRLGIFFRVEYLLGIAVLLSYIGVRAQVVSWLVIAIFLHFVSTKTLWGKYKILAPLYFLLWANIHGSWSAGIAILGATLFFRTLRIKKLLWLDYFVLLMSFLATLINPYTTGLWREVWLSLTDPFIRSRINEWKPAFVNGDIITGVFVTYALTVVIKSRKSFKLEELAVFILILSQALLSRRHMPLFVFTSLPLISKATHEFYLDISKIKFGKKRFLLTFKYFSIIILGLFSLKTIQVAFSTKSIAYDTFYPHKATAYLKQNSPKGEIFSYYGWGGYLIQEYPEKKVFVYGAMPSWRWDNPPRNELSNAFDTYFTILEGETDYKSVFETYTITTILFPKPLDIKQNDNSIGYQLNSLVSFFQPNKENAFNFFMSLEENGWEKTYEDTTAVIYQKQSSTK